MELIWDKIGSRGTGIEFEEITLGPGINVFVGANGVGKSTIMNYISNGSEHVYLRGSIKLTKNYIDTYEKSLKYLPGGWSNTAPTFIFDPIKWLFKNTNMTTIRKKPAPDTTYTCFYSEGNLYVLDQGSNWYFELNFTKNAFPLLDRKSDMTGSLSETLQLLCEETWNNICLDEKLSTRKSKEARLREDTSMLEKFDVEIQKKTAEITSVFTKDIRAILIKTDDVLNEHYEIKEELMLKNDFVLLGKSKRELSYDDLSSGQKAELNLFAYLQINKFSLLDEPELSLSYNKVSMLTNRLKNSGGQKLISTHSTVLLESLRFSQNAKIIRLFAKDSKTQNTSIDIKELQDTIKDNIFKNTTFTSMFRALFSDHVLLVEGANDSNVIFSNEEIYDILRINNIEIWPMNSKSKIQGHIDLMKKLKIDYSILVDEDARSENIVDENLTYLGDENIKEIEAYIDIEKYPQLTGMKINKKQVTDLLNQGIWPFKKELLEIVLGIINKAIK